MSKTFECTYCGRKVTRYDMDGVGAPTHGLCVECETKLTDQSPVHPEAATAEAEREFLKASRDHETAMRNVIAASEAVRDAGLDYGSASRRLVRAQMALNRLRQGDDKPRPPWGD